MCSQTHAAMRWTLDPSGTFTNLYFRYICRYSNGTVVHEVKFKCSCIGSFQPCLIGCNEQRAIFRHSLALLQNRMGVDDPCFTTRPIRSTHTGVSSVGYELWTGIECDFRASYRLDGNRVPTTTCTIKSNHMFVFVPTHISVSYCVCILCRP